MTPRLALCYTVNTPMINSKSRYNPCVHRALLFQSLSERKLDLVLGYLAHNWRLCPISGHLSERAFLLAVQVHMCVCVPSDGESLIK